MMALRTLLRVILNVATVGAVCTEQIGMSVWN